MMFYLNMSVVAVLIAGQDATPFPLLSENLAAVRKSLASHGQPWPEAIDAALLKATTAHDADGAIEAVAARVFLVVTINPEGRVRVARGGYTPILERAKAHWALVKVNNQSGGQQRLSARVACISADFNPFDLSVDASAPLTADLKGFPLEYRLLKISCGVVGQREATISFNAGQGTEDLGFRGETPVLFQIRR
jgi:hypothetical protein